MACVPKQSETLYRQPTLNLKLLQAFNLKLHADGKLRGLLPLLLLLLHM